MDGIQSTEVVWLHTANSQPKYKHQFVLSWGVSNAADKGNSKYNAVAIQPSGCSLLANNMS